MARNPDRPLSPHLTIWKWGPHMAVSILHRITGVGLALVGMGLFTWWLVAAASGAEAYGTFAGWAAWKWALLIWVPLSWAFFQHTLSGMRHFVMDAGAGYELNTNKFWSWAVLLLALVLTALLWAWIFYGRAA
jgi:succinate dehydrogenase / fumarate reductase, cytochrome b subunit